MMFREVVLIILLLFCINPVNGQNTRSDSICWDKNYKLKWSDFEGTKSSNDRWKAVSNASIRAKGYMDRGLPNYKVFNCFIKKSSWTIDTVSTDLLEHEQLHFDIAELYARRIRKAIESLRKKKVKKFDSYVPVIEKLLNEREAMDVKYDKETTHSMDLIKQQEWAKKIAKELAELKKYSSNKKKLKNLTSKNL